MSEPSDHFSGKFVGEETRPVVRVAKPTEQEAAIAKYAAHAERLARRPPRKRAPISYGRLVAIGASLFAACMLAGIVLFKFSPKGSTTWHVGEYLLIAAAAFVVALIYVSARRRR